MTIPMRPSERQISPHPITKSLLKKAAALADRTKWSISDLIKETLISIVA